MRHNVGMRYFIFISVISFVSAVVADEQVLREQRLWGPAERLNDLLLTSPENNRAMQQAFRLLEQNDAAGAVTLLEIFGAESDEFQPISPAATGLRQVALQRLGSANPTVRSAWQQAAEPLAKAQLAEVSPSVADYLLLARRFPLTVSASHALRCAAALELSHGRTQTAMRLQQAARDQIRGRFSAKPGTTEVLVAGHQPNSMTVSQLPMPQVAWEWHEKSTGLPSGNSHDVVEPSRFQKLIRRNSWTAVAHNGSLLLRTPLRFVALDPQTGVEKWSLVTDSIHDQFQSTIQQRLAPQLISADWMNNATAAWWTVCDSRLFYIDGQTEADYRTGFERDSLPGRQGFGLQIRRNFVMGSRLVAASLSESGTVLWQVGQTDSPTKTDFQDHLFCAAPVCLGNDLYVISAAEHSDRDERIFYLNCLNAATGYLNWRTALIVAEPRKLISHQKFSACTVSGDIVTCVINDQAITGVHRLDGRLLFASAFERPSLLRRLNSHSAAMSPVRPPVGKANFLFHTSHKINATICCDTKTGQPVWQVNRTVDVAGKAEGSQDLYPIQVTNDGLLLAGSRHVRMLNLKDGRQRWIAAIDGIAGQPQVTDLHCRLLTPDGKLIQIELRSGKIQQYPFRYAAGSLMADAENIFSVTADSVHAYRQALPLANAATATEHVLHGNTKQAQQLLASQTTFTEADAELLVRLSSSEQSVPEQVDNFAAARRLMAVKGFSREPSRLTYQDLQSHVRLSDGREVQVKRAIDATRVDFVLQASGRQLTNREQAAEWIVNPHGLTVDQILALVESLEMTNQKSAADLLLSSAIGDFPEHRAKFLVRRKQLRTGWAAALLEEVPPSVKAVDENSATEILRLETDDAVWNLLSNMDEIVDVPSWYRCKLLRSGRVLSCFDQHTGRISGRLRLPEQCQFGPMPESVDLPATIPFISVDDSNRAMFGMIGLLNPAAPRILWHRSMPFREADSGYCRLAGFSARYLFVQSPSALYCLHPLTGELMWSQPFSVWDCRANQQDLQNAVPFGDHQMVGLLGPLQKHATVFNAQDGRLLHQVSIRAQQSRAIVRGRIALYPKVTDSGDWQVCLQYLDQPQQENLLADDRLLLAQGGNVILLNDGTALCLDKQLSLVQIDLHNGRVGWKSELAEHLQDGSRYSVDAYEIGRLLIVNFRIPNRRNFYGQTGSRWHEQRLMPGFTACFQRDDGRLKWITEQKQAAVIQPIFGDAAPFFVTWNRRTPAINGLVPGRIRLQNQDYALQLKCRDLNSGKVLIDAKHLHTDEPYHGTYDTEKRQAIILSRRAEVRLQFEQ